MGFVSLFAGHQSKESAAVVQNMTFRCGSIGQGGAELTFPPPTTNNPVM